MQIEITQYKIPLSIVNECDRLTIILLPCLGNGDFERENFFIQKIIIVYIKEPGWFADHFCLFSEDLWFDDADVDFINGEVVAKQPVASDHMHLSSSSPHLVVGTDTRYGYGHFCGFLQISSWVVTI